MRISPIFPPKISPAAACFILLSIYLFTYLFNRRLLIKSRRYIRRGPKLLVFGGGQGRREGRGWGWSQGSMRAEAPSYFYRRVDTRMSVLISNV